VGAGVIKRMFLAQEKKLIGEKFLFFSYQFNFVAARA
jgi:hypothetical protein